jgi:hypothetical protein
VNTVLATDLDRTMIYSRHARALGADDATAVCVELTDGEPTSWMAAPAADELARLAADALVVPVTTRTVEQYRRVLLPGPAPRFAVAANGGVLLVDGRVDPDWTRRVAGRLRDCFPLDRVWDQLAHVCHAEFTDQLRNAAGLFCYAVVHPGRVPESFVADVSGWAAERGWLTSLQGSKLYLVPEQLTKSGAVARVCELAGADTVLAAGDSLLDIDLLLAADRGIHPRHGELYEQGWSGPRVVCTAVSGIAAGTEIVRWFRAQLAEPGSAFMLGAQDLRSTLPE